MTSARRSGSARMPLIVSAAVIAWTEGSAKSDCAGLRRRAATGDPGLETQFGLVVILVVRQNGMDAVRVQPSSPSELDKMYQE